MSTTTATYANPDLEARLELITRGLGRVNSADLELIRAILEEKENPILFWGMYLIYLIFSCIAQETGSYSLLV